MPELPDVEAFRRYLDSTALHQRIENVRVRHERVLEGVSARRLTLELNGRTFESTDRHGKYLFVDTGRAPWLVLHFGMTGCLEYEKDREPGDHDRVVFDFDNGYSLTYVCSRLLGKVTLTKSPQRFVQEAGLGPDALTIDAEQFASRVRGSRAAVNSCLMNQALLAGVGNIYSDEILFQSRISPRFKSSKVTDKQAGQLYGKMLHVLKMAADRKADPSKLPASWLLPHRDAGGPCPRCGGDIKKGKTSGRSAYWCPRCQRT
jgi:formamidopyrimidine-DNA glycosylase